MPATINYANRFQAEEEVSSYEQEEYRAGSYSSCIWEMQRPVVEKIITDFKKGRPGPVRLLDFACGTGRVLTVLEPLVTSAWGVDISPHMAVVARTKCPASRVCVGDILAQPDLLAGETFDLISCFRFVLNAEPALRVAILRRLREALAEPHGLLLVNVHGNARSLRHPAIAWKRRRQPAADARRMLNEMTPREMKELLRGAGFNIVRQMGFGIMPPTIYRTPLRGPAKTVDRLLAGENGWSGRSVDLLFVCQPEKNCIKGHVQASTAKH